MASRAAHEHIRQKPLQGFGGLWNISFGFFGIQIGFALQNGNMSRIFQALGASLDDLPALWIAAPLTGLLVQPIIGHMSDKTWLGKMGRRRPYFLAGAILAALSLLIMPLAPVLLVAAATLWLLDASLNISMEPFRAFVGDMLDKSQHTVGYAVQTAFIGAGAVVGSAFPWLLDHWNISNVAAPGQIPVINASGNPMLATAGTGDVLAGMLGTALAMPGTAPGFAFQAVANAVAQHGHLADGWDRERLGELTAGRLATSVRHLR